MVVERTVDVSNDAQSAADALTVHVTAGAHGSFTLFEDKGRTRITQNNGVLVVHSASKRDWTVVVHSADGSSRTIRAGQRLVINLR
jgi:VCBS repeat-containing protein